MTREEIIKEAQEQVNYCTPLHTKDFIHGYIAGAEPREKRIAELEKKDDQLTEAKELLERWIDDRPYSRSEMADLVSDTEQFLSEVEE